MHESDNPDQIKKMFDDKIRTYVSANSGDAYSHLRIQRETVKSILKSTNHVYLYKNFCILALGSGQRLLYRLWSGIGLVSVLVLRFCAFITL